MRWLQEPERCIERVKQAVDAVPAGATETLRLPLPPVVGWWWVAAAVVADPFFFPHLPRQHRQPTPCSGSSPR
jgi:hypothetical protein